MFNILSMEFYKLKHKKSFKFMLLGVIAFSLFFSIFSLIMVKENDLIPETFIVSGKLAFTSTILDNGTMMIVCAAFAGFFIGADFSNRTINMQVAAGCEKINILLGRAIAYFISTTLLIIIYPIIMTTIVTFSVGWGEVFTYVSFIFILRVLCLAIISNIGITSIFILFAFIFKDTAKTVTFSIIFSLLISAVLTMLAKYIPIFNIILKLSPFGKSSLIVQEFITLMQIIQILLSSTITVFIVLIITYNIFRKSELK